MRKRWWMIAGLTALAGLSAWGLLAIPQLRDRVGSSTPAAQPAFGREERWFVPVEADDPILGARDARVTVIEFCAFESVQCRAAAEPLRKLVAQGKGDVRVVWKDLPMFAIHARGVLAANAARHVFKSSGDAAFWAAHDKVFARLMELPEPVLPDLARLLEIEATAVTDPAAQQEVKLKLERSAEIAAVMHIASAPSYVINGRRWVGPLEPARLREMVDEELARARSACPERKKCYERLLAGARRIQLGSDLARAAGDDDKVIDEQTAKSRRKLKAMGADRLMDAEKDFELTEAEKAIFRERGQDPERMAEIVKAYRVRQRVIAQSRAHREGLDVQSQSPSAPPDAK